MKMKNNEKIERTLSSLDHLQHADAGDDFYQKLRERMKRREGKVVSLRHDLRWQSMAAAVLLLFSVNVAVMLNYSSDENKDNTSDVIANEYDLLPDDSYNLLITYENN